IPASTGTHCSKWVSQRGVIRAICGAVLVAFASCLAATSPSAVCCSGSSAIRRVSFGLLLHGCCQGGARFYRGRDRQQGRSPFLEAELLGNASREGFAVFW